MRNSIIIVGIFFSTVFSCKAQEKEIFKLKANWKKGEVKEMIVQQSGYWKMNGQENTTPTKISAKYQITIIDKIKKGYVVEWRILNTIKKLEESEFLKEYVSQFKYVIETDLNGNFEELSNWKPLVELNKELKEKIISEAKKENVSQLELENIISQMKLAETKEELIINCKRLTDAFHGFYGEELPLNDTILKPTTIPNEHFKEGIPATLETTTKELGKNTISIKYAYLYDYEKLKELQDKYFPDQENPEQRMISYSDYIYNIKTGWIEKIIFYSEFWDTDNKNISIIEYIIK